MKICSKCKLEKDLSLFYKNSKSKDGYRANCKSCQDEVGKKWRVNNQERLKQMSKEYHKRTDVKKRRAEITRLWNRENVESTLLTKARQRAKSKNIQCNINKEDIIVPKFCPILGMELKISDGKMSKNSPTLDRIDNQKGYIKGNIQVISCRANTIKNDSSFEEIEKIFNWYKKIKHG